MKATVHMMKLLSIALAIVVFVGAQTAHALTISPAKIEVMGDPGQTIRGEIKLFNEQDESRTFYASYENFEPRGDTGSPYFIGAKDGLATWMSTTDVVSIGSGQRTTVPYSITIPSDATPGGYFAAIFFGSQPPKAESGGEVSIGGKVGVLVLLRVAGDVAEEGGVTSFAVAGNDRLHANLPIAFEYRVSNAGGDRIVPRGEIKIKNTIRLKAAVLGANETEGSVLPSSERKFTVTWDKDSREPTGFFGAVKAQWQSFHIGWYTAVLHVSLGATQTATERFNFFIVPWQLLIVVLVVIGILYLILRAMLRSYKRRIMRELARQR
jgi:hypothetical protein